MAGTSRSSLVVAAALAAALAGPWADGARAGGDAVAFVNGIEDLPLMPGLEEAEDRGVVFDTPAGRIVRATAAGRVTRAQVVDFYAATLPQLGWRREGETAFLREDEILVLEFSAAKAGAASALTVRFALSPAKAGGGRRPEKP